MADTPHPAALPPDDLLADCDVQRTRRSGPGGQHRNKVSTAVVITHRPTGCSAEAGERRSQRENKLAAMRRLRLKLAIELRLPVPAGQGPSDLWRSRSGGGKVAVNVRHEDFPAMLSEAMDMLAACDLQPQIAAERLGCSTSQLVRMLRREPAALATVNRARAQCDLHPLR